MPDPDPKEDRRSPAQKDALEGRRDRSEHAGDPGAPPPKPDLREESHLGAAGDPAEGRRDED